MSIWRHKCWNEEKNQAYQYSRLVWNTVERLFPNNIITIIIIIMKWGMGKISRCHVESWLTRSLLFHRSKSLSFVTFVPPWLKQNAWKRDRIDLGGLTRKVQRGGIQISIRVAELVSPDCFSPHYFSKPSSRFSHLDQLSRLSRAGAEPIKRLQMYLYTIRAANKWDLNTSPGESAPLCTWWVPARSRSCIKQNKEKLRCRWITPQITQLKPFSKEDVLCAFVFSHVD